LILGPAAAAVPGAAGAGDDAALGAGAAAAGFAPAAAGLVSPAWPAAESGNTTPASKHSQPGSSV
jgi:hypothetical protein